MTRPRRPGRPAGFTLLEVLVALTILSLAVVASIQGFAAGLRLLKLAGEHQEAMLLADQKAREIITPTEGRLEQGSEGPYTWVRETKLVPTPDLAVDGRATPWRMWEIDVRVTWAANRQVQVATLRTVAGNPERVQAPGR